MVLVVVCHYSKAKNEPGNVGGVKDGEALRVLVVRDAHVGLEAEDLCVADVGPVQERAEEQKRQNRHDSVVVIIPVSIN